MNNKDKYRKSGDMTRSLHQQMQQQMQHPYGQMPQERSHTWPQAKRSERNLDLSRVHQQIELKKEWDEFTESKPALAELLRRMFGEGAMYVFRKCGPISESRALRMMGELNVQVEGHPDRFEKAIKSESIS